MDVFSLTAITVNFIRACIHCTLSITWQQTILTLFNTLLHSKGTYYHYYELTFVIDLFKVNRLKAHCAYNRDNSVYRHLKVLRITATQSITHRSCQFYSD